MKKLTIILCLMICFYSCKSSKNSKKSNRSNTSISTSPSKAVINNDNGKISTSGNPKIGNTNSSNITSKLAEKIVDYAMKFEGVRYKYGGTDKRGMDCSGLVTTAFSHEDISLPRSSSDIALVGDWVDIKEVQKGDLLFFATNGKSRKISHVALVTQVNQGQIEFIHSSTSAGVIVSSLAEKYWYFAFVQARRVI